MKRGSVRSLALAAAVMLLSGWSFKSLFYEDIPDIRMAASYRYNIGGSELFVLTYSIYHRPKGITRFPDGGTPDYVFGAKYLAKVEDGSIKAVAELPPIPYDIKSPEYIKLKAEGDGVIIRFNGYAPGRYSDYEKDVCYLFDPGTGKLSRLESIKEKWEKGKFFHIALRSYDRGKKFYRFEEAGLPDPVDYIRGDRSPKALARLIRLRKGPLSFRLSAALRLVRSGNKDLLSKVLAEYDDGFDEKKALWTIVKDRNEEKQLLADILNDDHVEVGK